MYNILVCDDEKDIVSALTIYLQAEGYQVFGASNGLQALETLRHEQIHLVLLDIMMPGLDGLHTCSACASFPMSPSFCLRKIRGQRQNPRPHCRGGRLCDKAL